MDPRISRGLRLLWREALFRSLPHGLMNWRYLQRRPPPLIRAHRQIWWSSLPGLPRPIWLVLQLWLWLRWQLFGGWRSCWRGLRDWGPRVAAEEGMSLSLQCRLIVPMVLGWCVPAADIYRLRCHAHPERFLHYVYRHETTAFHRWRSGEPSRRSLILLQDKACLSQLLSAHALPVVSILARVPRGSARELRDYLPADLAVFCKSRSGRGGQGAFAAWWEAGVVKGQAFSGHRLLTAEVDAAWRRLLDRDDVLVQPRLTSHPAFHSLTGDEDVVTVRVISVWRHGAPRCLCAMLEIPVGAVGNRVRYLILPLMPSSGTLSAFPAEYLSQESRCLQSRFLVALQDWQVPDWARIIDWSYQAHRLFSDYWAIAWDWAITGDGPQLLEGNAGWGATIPQILYGGLLAEHPGKTPGVQGVDGAHGCSLRWGVERM